MYRQRVGVLRGGPSSEYEVSLKSGATVLRSLPDEYEPVDIFISKGGEWHVGGAVRPPEKIINNVDVVFNALHGEYGEDGKVQTLLESYGVPFTGSGAFSSALAMNKARAKEAVRRVGIKIPSEIIVRREDDLSNLASAAFRKFAPPYVVKPVALGSSVGVKLVRIPSDLPAALEEVFTVSPVALIEEYIFGKEATCGVAEGLRGQKVYVLPTIEIRLPAGSSLFDYNAKYSGATEEICPGCFAEREKRLLEEAARKAHEALSLRHYSRSDFIVSPTRGVVFLETNTLPGLTEASLLPKALAAVGVSFPEFLAHLIKLALK